MAEGAHVRQEHLHQLAEFCRGLRESFQRAGANPAHLEAIRSHVSAECVLCGERVSGPDLLALAESEPSQPASPRARRLRQGYCARTGCDSVYYRVTCASHPGMDWPKYLSAAEAVLEENAASKLEAEEAAKAALKQALRKRLLAGAVLLLCLLAARQLYLGGSIPFLRQPENFQVDRRPERSPA